MNEDYDSHQGNEQYKSLPLTKDLVFVSYTGFSSDDDEVQGLLLIYKDFQAIYAIEEVLTSKGKSKQVEDLAALKTTICEVLLAINEARNFADTPKRHYM